MGKAQTAKAKGTRPKAKPRAAKVIPPVPVLEDATISAVMFGGHWHKVSAGSWRVNLNPPYLHAAWLDPVDGTKYSAPISKLEAVCHGFAPPVAEPGPMGQAVAALARFIRKGTRTW